MKDAIFKGFPKQLAFSQPLPSGSLPISSSSSLLSETEVAREAHSVQPNAVPAAASMPSLLSSGEATAELAPISKNSGKPPRHPRINALMGARGKGQPLLPSATPINSPAPVPTGSSVDAVMSEPMAPGPVPASPAAHAEVDPTEQPTPGTPLGSPMMWSPTPLVADAAPLGTSTQAEAAPFGTPSNASQTLAPSVSEPSPSKSPLKSLSKAFALPKKAPGKTSTKGKGLAGSPPAKAASKLMSPIKFIFGSSTSVAKVDAASDQLPMASSLALEASVPTHAVDSAAVVVAASSSAQPSTDASSLLGTSRIPIRKPGLSSDEDSKAVLTKLASSGSNRSSFSALPRAHHRAGMTQPMTTAAERGPTRNPFAKFGLQTSQTAPEGTSAKSSSLLHSRSVLKHLASRGKENTGAASSSHLEVAPASASAHPQPLATSNKLGGATGVHY